jgi:HEAT repeat protein
MLALAAAAAAPQATAQVSPASRARKFWQIYSRADANGKSLAFDVLSPADSPVVLSMCFKAMRTEHPLVVAAAAAFLAETAGAEALDKLFEKGVTHKRRPVRIAALRSLADNPDPRVPEALVSLLGEDDWLVRALALNALGRRRHAPALSGVAAAISDPDPRVRVAALDALAAYNDLTTADAVVAGLKDPAWQVRSTAIAAVKTMRPRSAVEPLIDRMAVEKGRLRLEAYKTLVWLVGRDLGEDPTVWREWWAGRMRKKGSKGRVEREQSEYAITRRKSVPRKFFRVQTDSRSVVFVLDLSESMNSFSKAFRSEEGKTRVGHSTRFTVLIDELLRTVKSFDENVMFNIVLFSSDVSVWRSTLQRATPVNKSKAISFVRARGPSGDTNVFDALAAAFGVSKKALASGRGYFDEAAGLNRTMNFENGPDTIFFLSDGVPNRGQITEGNLIVEEITRVNRLRRIVIHTIVVGRFSADFLHALAADNNGFAASVGD